MPGGVGGAGQDCLAAPIPIFGFHRGSDRSLGVKLPTIYAISHFPLKTVKNRKIFPTLSQSLVEPTENFSHFAKKRADIETLQNVLSLAHLA